VLDASSFYAGGLYHGQNYRAANPQHCKDLNNEIILNMNLGYYNESSLPFYVQVVTAKYSILLELSDDLQEREIYQVNCLPASCTYDDLVQVMSYYTIFQENQFIQDAVLIDLRILDENFKFYKDINFYIVM
jgi:hypothetical protein